MPPLPSRLMLRLSAIAPAGHSPMPGSGAVQSSDPTRVASDGQTSKAAK